MMVTNRARYINFFIITVLLVLFNSLQTTLWYQFFRSSSAPAFWVLVFVYLILYRPPVEALLQIYILCLFVFAFTAQPIGILWLSWFVLFAVIYFSKKIVFWPGPKYFLIASAAAITVYQIVFLICSWIFESQPAPISIASRLSVVLLTTLAAAPCYWLFKIIDQWTLPKPIEGSL